MPIIRESISASGGQYANPFVGEAEYPVMVPCNIANLTANEVDQYGYIKAGVPLSAAGALIANGTTPVFGVVPESVRVAAGNDSGSLTAAGTVQVTVIVIGLVNRHLAEANLGRAYTANEVTGFGLAGCRVVLAS